MLCGGQSPQAILPYKFGCLIVFGDRAVDVLSLCRYEMLRMDAYNYAKIIMLFCF